MEIVGYISTAALVFLCGFLAGGWFVVKRYTGRIVGKTIDTFRDEVYRRGKDVHDGHVFLIACIGPVPDDPNWSLDDVNIQTLNQDDVDLMNTPTEGRVN